MKVKLHQKRTKRRISHLIRAMLINRKVVRMRIKLRINSKGNQIRIERLKTNYSSTKEAAYQTEEETTKITTEAAAAKAIAATAKTGTTPTNSSNTTTTTPDLQTAKTTTKVVATNNNTITQEDISNPHNMAVIPVVKRNQLHTIHRSNSSSSRATTMERELELLLRFNSINMVLVLGMVVIRITSRIIISNIIHLL